MQLKHIARRETDMETTANTSHVTSDTRHPLDASAIPVVFFDGGCPMCRREIAHYRKLRGANQLLWVDIVESNKALANYGLSYSEAMARFHVLDTEGRWQTGAAGFVELWSHLPTYRWLAQTIRMLRLLPVLDAAYTPFARWRMRGRCTQDSCGIAKIEK
jgi:predicted DCC family thiol-disulfide oxidoreductase YuxK